MTAQDSLERYHRQMLLGPIGRQGQESLTESVALVAGVGALGTAAAEGLARAGVGTLILVDRDVVELTNLQRQVLFDERDVAEHRPKAEAARCKLEAINRHVHVSAIVDDLDYRNIETIAGTHGPPDVIVDGLDNFETRFLLNDYAVKHAVPYIYGGAVGTEGMVYPVLPAGADRGATPCLRCLFGGPPLPGTTPTCDTAGVLGPTVAVTAALEVAIAVKVLAKRRNAIKDELVQFDLWRNRWHAMPVEAGACIEACPCCGKGDYEFLDGRGAGRAASLCGRHAVQLARRAARGDVAIDLEALALKLQSHGHVKVNQFLLRLDWKEDDRPYELTLFRDGRAIVKGTDDVSVARGLFNRYIGG